MTLRILSWNVEHFKGGSKVEPVADLIKKANPDVFALYEVEHLNVLQLMRDHFPTFSFQITDGPEVQEILVGYRNASAYQATFTQKREFKAHNPALRPGAMLTLRRQNKYLNLLFLHTDSGTDAAAFGNRDEMFEKVWKAKTAIDKMSGVDGHLIVTGDLNTMGLFFPTKAKKNEAVSADREIQVLSEVAAKSKMVMLDKEFDLTFNNNTLISNLDHVLASDRLSFKNLGTRTDGTPFQVAVRGWQQLSGADRKKFINDVSDHCALIMEVAF